MKNIKIIIGKGKNPDSFCRIMYIIEAALEYFIAMMVADAYLAKICKSIGMTDGDIGVLSAFVSLGCGMQIAAVFIAGRMPVKKMVCTGTLITNLCFVLVYLTPFFSVKKGAKSVILIVLLLSAQLIKNVVHSPKIDWFMSFVSDSERGIFTANKEIISLIGGMVFTFAMGVTIDAFEAAGDLYGGFLVSAITVFALGVLHILTMILTKDKPQERTASGSRFSLKSLVSDKCLMKIVLFSVLWHVVNYSTTPFYGAYKVDSLGFTMTFNSILTVGYSIIRSVVSRPMGRFADRRSFASMMTLCFVILSASLFVNIFTVPSNGRIMFTMYYILYAVAMAGINSGVINLLYDYVPHEKRTASFAFQNTVSGLAGFGTTWLVSRIVEYIQQSGNMLFGINIYAQQAVSAIGFLFSIAGIMYLVFVVKRIPRS